MMTKKRGVKIGFKHEWDYDSERWVETKVSPKRWKFTFFQTKTRHGSNAPKGSGFPEKGRLHWKILADQYAVKVGPNKYKLITKGIKRLAGYKEPNDKKWK